MSIQDFNYLNNNDSSAVIDKTQAQDLLNVDVTPSGHSIKKRQGYGLYKTLTGSAALHGGYHFFDSSGNDVQVWGSSTSLWGIVSDAAATQLISSGTLSTTWACTDIAAFGYCVNSSRDALIKTNGATMTWLSVPSGNIGTMIISTPDRLVVAGSAASPSTLFFSGSNNYTNFTNGILATDPFPEIIAAPGSKLTHIKYAFGRILWWKDQSFGYVLGTDQTNLQIGIVSSSVGTQDDADAIDPAGNVYFRGQDGHVYKYDGASLTKITTEITPLIQNSGHRVNGQWPQTTQADFQAGISSPTANLIFSAAGDMSLSTSTILVNSPDFESGPNNVSLTVTGWNVNHPLGAPEAKVLTASSTACGTTLFSANTGSYYFLGGQTSGQSSVQVSIVDNSGNVLAAIPNLTANACTWTSAYLVSQFYAGTSVKIQIAELNSTNNTKVTSNLFTWPGAVQFKYIMSDWTAGGFYAMDTIITAPSTGTYLSAVHNAPSLTTWSTLSATDAKPGASTIAYYLRASTNSFTVSSSTPSWSSAQTIGALPTISTGTFFQLRADFSITATTEAPTINDFTVNWFEGTASDRTYSIFYDNALWWSFAYGPGQSTNNYIFKYDLLTPGWTLYNFGAGGFLVQNNNLYFGSTGANGKIYKYGNSSSDDGTAINAYWKSKDFVGPDVFLENELQTINVATKTQPGETLTVTYTLNTSTSTSFSIPLTNATDSLIRYKKLIPPGKMGGFFNVKFSDTSTGSRWEVFGVKFDLKPLTYRPS
jgi:hypothetical protein